MKPTTFAFEVARVNATSSGVVWPSRCLMMSSWSPPEQKPLPRPVMTTARMSSCESISSNVSASSW